MNVRNWAQIKRLNRKLAPRDEKLCVSRPDSRMEYNVGEFYILDTYRNAIMQTHVNPDALEAELIGQAS